MYVRPRQSRTKGPTLQKMANVFGGRSRSVVADRANPVARLSIADSNVLG